MTCPFDDKGQRSICECASPKMRGLQVSAWLLLLVWLQLSCPASHACPDLCLCFLTTVRCTNGRLTGIPRDGMPESTTVLDLRYSRMREIRKQDFTHLPNLVTLFLSENQIRYIEPGSFSQLKKLKDLYLYSNRIRNITDETFSGLSNLEQLYLQHNDISHISRHAFVDLVSLQRLYLQRNRITTIPREWLDPLGSLRTVRMESNLLNCDCAVLLTVKEFLKTKAFQLVASCHDPPHLRGKMLTAVSTSTLNCSPPTLGFQRKDVNAAYGGSVRMECIASGNPKPQVTWRFRGRSVYADERVVIDAPGVLSISRLVKDDAGHYECMARNVMGSVEAVFRVNLYEEEALPNFTDIPTDTEVIIDNAAILRCRAIGKPRPRIFWTRHGEVVADGRFRILPVGDLEITRVREEDQGYFTCRAQNTIGSVTHTARLIVKAAPTFTRKPQDTEILESETASFECRAIGFPVPAIVWNKEGHRLPSDGRHIVLPSGTLRILYAGQENVGKYECQAINVIGVNVASASLTVKARVPPKIVKRPPDTTVQSGNTIFFTCEAEGAPTPVITWIKDGVQVSNGNRFTTNASTGTLEIKDIGKIDEGRWECAARNSIGFASEAFQLTVVGLKDGEYKGDKFVRPSVEKAINEVNRAIELTKQSLQNFTPRSPGDLLALFRFPSPAAFEIARAAEIFEIAIEFIQKQVDSGRIVLDKDKMEDEPHFNALVSPDHIQLLANLSGCTAHHNPVNCSDLCFHLKYRTYDGSCNNFNHPMWGASLTPFSRLLSPIYENGLNTPVGWNKTDGKPSARLVSQKILVSHDVTDDEDYTHMLMQWGQFLDHDMDFTVTSPSTSRFKDGIPCSSTCENQHPCFPIPIPKSDVRIRNHECMEFTRSSAVCGSGSTSVFFNAITPRQQINQITSYIDASNVYGSSEHDAKNLRDFENDDGLLKIGLYGFSGKPFLPFNKDTPIDCQVNKTESKVPCFLAGDHRANEQLGLLAMHTLWMREHNKVAKKLKELNPDWKGEEIYQEARKIVGAEMQHITVTEWLPKILGPIGMEKLGTYQGYNPNVDATIFNAFATAAFRFGHTLIQPVLQRLNEEFKPIKEGHLPLHKAFFSPHRLIQEGGIDPLLRGLFASPAKSRASTDQLLTNQLTEHLFQMAHAVALDLGALNIQRARDHGLPGYNSWRQFCNMSLATTFDDFSAEIKKKEVRDRMEEQYGKPDNVDLWIGAIAEDPLEGSRLGPLLTCLIVLQFKRLRDGDRFWYENPGVFTSEQLTQIKQVSLARVLCDNGDNIKLAQPDVFRFVRSKSDYKPCKDIPNKDLRFWKACCKQDSCSAKDRTYTVSNLVRERRSLQVANVVRKKRSLQTPNGPDGVQPNARGTEEYEHERRSALSSISSDKGSESGENLGENLEPVLIDRITELKDKVLEMDKSLHKMKEEISLLKRAVQTCYDKDAQKIRKNSEIWTRKQQICRCLAGQITCQGSEDDGQR